MPGQVHGVVTQTDASAQLGARQHGRARAPAAEARMDT